MKILFLMGSPEYLRFFDSVIGELAARGHQVTLAVGYGREKKPVGLEGLHAHFPNVRVAGVVPQAEGMWADIAFRLRGIMDFVRYLHPRFAAAPALRARMKRKVLPSAYHWLDAIPRVAPDTVRRLERVLMAGEQAVPLNRLIVDFLRNEAPDVLLVSPLVASASPQVDWIKAARACGIRTAVCVASWDNLTNKGLMRVEPDLVVVWNDAQKREASEYHYIPAEKVVTTGAQPFDRWFARQVTRERDAFCARVGLPDDGPFILFTGSSAFISRSNVEVPFVRRWIASLRASDDPVLQRINILVRPHPYNYHSWATDPLADLSGVRVFPPRGYNPVDEENRADFFDSLHHCTAVVGVNTSAMIEAAILGRPVFSMLSEEFAGTQEGTIHFRHLLPENGGCVRIAATLDAHVAQLSERLADPGGSRAEARRFVSSFIRPHGLDRPATPLFVEALERLAAQPAPARQGTPWWAPLAWPVLWLAALPAWAVDRLAAGPLPAVRKHASWALHRARKIARGAGVRIGTRWQRLAKRVARVWHRSIHRLQRSS